MKISNEERETLERLEEELWREETRFDTQRMNKLIAQDFFEFGRSGRVYQRQHTLAVARQPCGSASTNRCCFSTARISGSAT